jgi:hypothetical protein
MNGPIHPSQSVYHCRIVCFLLQESSNLPEFLAT